MNQPGSGVSAGSAPGASGSDTAAELAGALEEATRPHVSAVLLFGSRLVGASPGAHSAYDLLVVVDAYPAFYRSLVASGHHPRSPRVLATLARVLPPNVTAFSPDLPGEPMAKCMILSARHFERALSPAARDHFVKGRMAQLVEVVYARDRRVATWVEDLLAEGRRDVLRWAGPQLEGSFGAAELARRMLRVSYRGELRPEARDRVEEVFRAQRPRLEALYAEMLREEVRRGTVEEVGEGIYRLREEPGIGARWSLRWYFARSKTRAVLRWFKHIVTFADWLEYIRRKVERRTGRPIELTERERKYPLVFLWPKAFRVLRDRPPSVSEGPAEGPHEPPGGHGEADGPPGDPPGGREP